VKRLSYKPRVAGLFIFEAKPEQRLALRVAATALLRAGWKLLAVPVLRPSLAGLKVGFATPAAVARRSGVMVSLGGDGTLLGAAALAAPLNKPVLGVNLGGLGFMTALSPDGLGLRLPQVLDGGGREEPRRLVRGELWRSKRRVAVLEALNDLVVARAGAGRLTRLQATLDGSFLGQFRADGLIFASPTGSTAYALSVGGPVVDPRTKVLLLALVSPHTLSNRPLVIAEDSVLDLQLPDSGIEIYADGNQSIRAKAGDRLRLMRSPHQARLIFAAEHDPWAVLRDKLGWQGQTTKDKRRA
jgi:NAD+ kinase